MPNKKSKPTHGGARTGAGRTKRKTAVKKTVLIEKTSVEFLTQYGDGYLGRGIDKIVTDQNKKITKGE